MARAECKSLQTKLSGTLLMMFSIMLSCNCDQKKTLLILWSGDHLSCCPPKSKCTCKAICLCPLDNRAAGWREVWSRMWRAASGRRRGSCLPRLITTHRDRQQRYSQVRLFYSSCSRFSIMKRSVPASRDVPPGPLLWPTGPSACRIIRHTLGHKHSHTNKHIIPAGLCSVRDNNSVIIR